MLVVLRLDATAMRAAETQSRRCLTLMLMPMLYERARIIALAYGARGRWRFGALTAVWAAATTVGADADVLR